MKTVKKRRRWPVQPSIRRVARAYVNAGFKIIPVPKGKKAPCIKGWQKLDISRQKVAEYFKPLDNIGMLLGAKADWLVDVDLDADEAVAAAGAFLPKTGWIHGHPRNPRSHHFYRAKGVKTRRFVDPEGRCLVELRSTGSQTIVPPSLHPSGQRYMWDRSGKPSRVAANELSKIVARLAACALVARNWPKKGDRQGCALALAGMLLRAGLSVRAVEHFVKTASKVASDEEYKKRATVARATKNKLRRGQRVTGRRALTKILGDKVVNLMTNWLAIGQNPEKQLGGKTSRDRDFKLTAVRLLEMDPGHRQLVEVKAEVAGRVWKFCVAPAVVRDPRRLAGVIADRTGEMLNNDDPQLVRLRDQISGIPRVRAVSRLGWTAQQDAFMYGQLRLTTAGHKKKVIFLPAEMR